MIRYMESSLTPTTPAAVAAEIRRHYLFTFQDISEMNFSKAGSVFFKKRKAKLKALLEMLFITKKYFTPRF